MMEDIMRFVSFEKNGTPAVGCLVSNEDTIIDLTGAGLPDDLNSIVEMGETGFTMKCRDTMRCSGTWYSRTPKA